MIFMSIWLVREYESDSVYAEYIVKTKNQIGWWYLPSFGLHKSSNRSFSPMFALTSRID